MKKFNVPPASKLEKAISHVAPKWALNHYKTRVQLSMASHYGASTSRRQTSEWVVSKGKDADSDDVVDLSLLRDRSRDLIRNNPLAGGALKTKATNVIGNGLKFQARINNEFLGMSDEDAETWNTKTEMEFNAWSNNADCDIERTLNFGRITALMFKSMLDNGDSFCLLPFNKRANDIYGLKLQCIEADRIANGGQEPNTRTLINGIELDSSTGEPVAYRILRIHPGSAFITDKNDGKIDVVKAYGEKSGRKNIIHLFTKNRIGQHRGLPDLSPVIELFKQLGTYTEAEVAAAVISAMFTVFIKSDMGDVNILAPMEPKEETGAKTNDDNYKMAAAAILDLAPGEDVEFANPTRPNSGFDAFTVSIIRQIGVALELPYEILIKHFTASYSASRAAMIIAWQYFMSARWMVVNNFCKPVFEEWFVEAVLLGRIDAPGFIGGDPLVRAAYLNSEWVGPGKPQIDEGKEVQAAIARMDANLTTLADEVAANNGGNWQDKLKQRAKEKTFAKMHGLESEPKVPVQVAPEPEQTDDDKPDTEVEDKLEDETDEE